MNAYNRTALAHYSAIAAQAVQDRQEEDDAMREVLEIAAMHIKSALQALDDGNQIAAAGYVDDAIIELRGAE
jgi:hypothetical protein